MAGGAMAVVMGSLLCLLFVIRTALVAGLHAIIPTCLNDMINLPTVLIATQHNNWLLGKKSTLWLWTHVVVQGLILFSM